MSSITSADGTTIGYECTGSGPALVLVDGAMCCREAGPMRPLATYVGVPEHAVAGIGSQSGLGLQQAAKATAQALPTAEHRTLDGQTHDVAPEALAPVLVEFFST